VHISDITALFSRIIEKILSKDTIPSGAEGYYFAGAHKVNWWAILDRLAVDMKARDLVTDETPQIWESDDAAAEGLGIPAMFLKPFFNSQ
jgi:hypothetical protein